MFEIVFGSFYWSTIFDHMNSNVVLYDYLFSEQKLTKIFDDENQMALKERGKIMQPTEFFILYDVETKKKLCIKMDRTLVRMCVLAGA